MSPHACGYCITNVGEVHDLLPRGCTAYEFARLSLALRVAREAVRAALAPLTARLGRRHKSADNGVRRARA